MSFLGDLSPQQGLNNLAGNLAQNTAMNQGNQAAIQQQQINAAAQQAQLNSLYGPQGFGGQTAYYAGQGADYGRATGYYGDTQGLTPGQTTPAAQAALYGGFDNSQYLSGLGQYGGGAVDSGDPGFNGYAGASYAPAAQVPYYGMPSYAPLGYTPDTTQYQNGFGYPSGPGAGAGVNPSQMFDPNTYGSLGMGVPAVNRYNPNYRPNLPSGGASSFNDWYGQLVGATPQQVQNQPALDAVNNFARGVPQLSDFGSQSPFLNFAGGSNPYGGYVASGDPGGNPYWGTDSYGNATPSVYSNNPIYDNGAYGTNTGFQQFGMGLGTSAYMPGFGSPASGVVGPQPDTFTGWNYPGGSNSFNARFPSGMQGSVDTGDPGFHAATAQGIQDLMRTLGIVDAATGGGSTLSGQDLSNR